jgi:hypothetical protein
MLLVGTTWNGEAKALLIKESNDRKADTLSNAALLEY